MPAVANKKAPPGEWGPSEVFGVIEDALRSRYAKPVTDARDKESLQESTGWGT
jgi:hypothetical protein